MSNVFAPPVDLRPDAEILAALVDETYTELARAPYTGFHFNTGASYAVERLGYDAGELLALPVESTARFAGLGNPLAEAYLQPGEVLPDSVCGARVARRFDAFLGTVSGRRIPRKYNLHAANIVAWRA